MVLLGLDAVLGVVVTVALAAGAVVGRALTPSAAIVAAAFGIAIVVLAGFPFLILLALFVVASALATRYRFEEKRQRSVQEGVGGERGISNVVAHIVVPTALAGAFAFRLGPPAEVAALYATALAFGASDTFASEFGVLAGRARSLLHGRPVAPGTNGGVSGTGEGFAFIGAGLTAVVGYGLFVLFGTGVPAAVRFLPIVAVAGFLGCQVDSLLGETLENRGFLGKGGTNFVAMVSSVGIAAVLFLAIGGAA